MKTLATSLAFICLFTMAVAAQGRGQRVQDPRTAGGGQCAENPYNCLDTPAAIVVHAKADDLKSDPAGNSGDRIACGVSTNVVPTHQ